MKWTRVLYMITFQSVFCVAVKGQNIPLLDANQLENRLSAGKDTTFVINFWATWCMPCLKELPNFEKLQQEFSGQKLKVILLSIDHRSKANSAVASFVRRQNLKNEVFVANEQKPQEYIKKIDNTWAGSLPATLIVNRSKDKRNFFEKEFTYSELLKEYNLFK
ncbi:MAG: TlpA disulfide reductase family protein [Daejeonella sp.]